MTKVIHEWFGEALDENGDIFDCCYWDENEREAAIKWCYQTIDEGSAHDVQFGRVRRVVDDEGDCAPREYSYFELPA